MAVFRRFTKRFFVICNLVLALLFIIACLTAYLDPSTYWFVGLLGVTMVFLTAGLLCFFFCWLFFKSRWAFLSFGCLALGWFQLHALFAFHPFTRFQQKKEEGNFRILTWNVARWDEMNKAKRGGESYRKKMMEFISTQDADIICLQEFLESRKPGFLDVNVPYIKEKLRYPYHYFVVDHVAPTNAYEHGIAIFSRYPIVDTLRIRYGTTFQELRGNESLIRATIDIEGKKINVFTTHLQSMLFSFKEYNDIEAIKRADTDSVMRASKGIISKFRTAYEFRSKQARKVRHMLDNSEYPPIITGDFNDVPNSYTYFTIKGNREDAFVNKGFGLGRTFVSISPTLRIDYIMADEKAYEITQCRKIRLPYSDHFPLVADFNFRPNEK